MKRRYWLVILFTAFSQLTSAETVEEQKKSSNHWLTDANNNTERFTRLETYLRGFDQPMWEVGHRYNKVYDAIIDENYELALYHWRKIKKTIENGYLKRPVRKSSSDSMFLQSGVWASLEQALQAKEKKNIQVAFSVARNICMSCHVVEKVPFMNNQQMFKRTALFPN